MAILPHAIAVHTHRILFAAMCLLAFYACLRIGEMCVQPGQLINNAVQRRDIHLVCRDTSLDGLELTLRTFKHSVRPCHIVCAG